MARASVSQAELARACGVKAPSVNGWLSGKSKFLRGENLLKAAARLGVSAKWLAEGKGPMRTPDGAPEDPIHVGSEPVCLTAALPVTLTALVQAPAASRPELAQILGLLVTTGSALYARRVGELLAQPLEPLEDRPEATPHAVPAAVAEWRKQAMRLAEAHTDRKSRALLVDFLGKLDTLMREMNAATENLTQTRQGKSSPTNAGR